MSEIERLLDRAQPGSRGGVEQHIRRGEHIQEMIRVRFGICHPQAWQVKHLRWALSVGLGGVAPATRYHYWRTVRVLAAVLGHWPDWGMHMRGAWMRPDGQAAPRGVGGRRPKLASAARVR